MEVPTLVVHTLSSSLSSGTIRKVRQPRSFFDFRTSPNIWSPTYNTSLEYTGIKRHSLYHRVPQKADAENLKSNRGSKSIKRSYTIGTYLITTTDRYQRPVPMYYCDWNTGKCCQRNGYRHPVPTIPQTVFRTRFSVSTNRRPIQKLVPVSKIGKFFSTGTVATKFFYKKLHFSRLDHHKRLPIQNSREKI